MSEVIQKLQFKRGTKENLETLLVGNAKPVVGEPIYEMDTGKLKIGNGTQNYVDLPYLAGDSGGFAPIITDPINEQVLVYNSATQKWINMKLTDLECLQGYLTQLQTLVTQAQTHATTAGSHATTASSKAVEAAASATQAAAVKTQMIDYVENKFWWGSLAEFNALEHVNDGGFYYIKPESNSNNNSN